MKVILYFVDLAVPEKVWVYEDGEVVYVAEGYEPLRDKTPQEIWRMFRGNFKYFLNYDSEETKREVEGDGR